MSRPKKILITGATGNIGSELLTQLKASHQLDGISVFARDSKKNRKKLAPYSNSLSIFWGDMMDSEALIPACKDQEVVIHMAGIIPPGFHKDDAQSMNMNVEGTRNVVEALEAHSPNAFLIFSSSVAVYGDRLSSPDIRVGDALDKTMQDQYGIGKILCEEIIQNSTLNWSILRLSAIMGFGNHKVSGIVFNVPLDTVMEICTVRDTARAMLHAPDHVNALAKRVLNLGGGENCRISYRDFMKRAFASFGMGKLNFPEHSFATCNFHCGDYVDGDDLEEILHFQSDTMDSYFKEFHANVPAIQRFFTRPFAGIAKRYLLSLSQPYKAFKSQDKEKMMRYFCTTNLKKHD